MSQPTDAVNRPNKENRPMIFDRESDPRRVDYDGNHLPFDPTCALCEFSEYPHEH